MSKKAIFQQLILDAIASDLSHVIPRTFRLPLNLPKVISLMGPRRAGKTHILLDGINQLREQIPRNRAIYINLEDDRLFPLQLNEMDDLIQGYYELFPENKSHTVHFFLDEVQEIAHWEKFIRRIFDQENCHVYITGSSSGLLGKEIATSLRGRTLPFEVLPLSFNEFLSFNKIDEDPRSSKGKATTIHYLKQYLLQGGFPELLFLPEQFHQRTIEEYLELMLYKDLVDRHKMRHPHVAKYLLKQLMNLTGRLMSLNKVYNDIKSQGHAVSKSTIYEYTANMVDAYMIVEVPLWTSSIRKQQVNPTKMYGIDPSFKHAMIPNMDWGQTCEQVVCLELLRRGHTPYYLKGHQEVDFYIEEGSLINVCYDLNNPNTLKREINSLLEGMEMMEQDTSLLISWDKEETITQNGCTIHVQPLWKWLLKI